MRELVIIISDLYLPPREAGQSKTSATVALPGLQQAARFGRKSPLGSDWRPWLARWLGRDDLARVAPASMVVDRPAAAQTGAPPGVATEARGDAVDADYKATAWLAAPVHLIASLTSLHLDPRSILQLSLDERATLAEDFNRAFADSRFWLQSVQAGVLVMHARGAVNTVTTEPARALVNEIEAALPRGPDAAALKRLGAELEMWLHAHPVNEARARRGELPVSTLWLWGGGATAANHGDPFESSVLATDRGAAHSDLLFGSDPYLAGLLRAHGSAPHALPEQLPDLRAHPETQRMAVVAEITPLLRLNPQWSVLEALCDLDRRFVAPAFSELRAGATATLILIANDIQLRIQRADAWKFWRRRPRSALDELRLD